MLENLEYILDDVEFCECIGNFEDEYVYDIEVDDKTHTFIGSDILVHNSLYISMSPLMQSIDYTGDELKFILHVNAMFIKHLFNEYLEEYAKPYKVKNIHDFELETINKSALHLEKKMYLNNVVWEDGAFHEDLTHYYPKGIDIVRSSTPLFVRENVWEIINYLFKNPNNLDIKEVLKIMKRLKKEFMLADIEDISQTTSLSNYEQKVIDDQSNLEWVKGAHHSVKSAALHNYLLNKNSHLKSKYDLLRGGKIKYYFCKSDYNTDRFAYLRSFHPTEIISKEGVEIDYDTQFEKCFVKLVNRFIEPVGLPTVNKRLSVLNSIFSSKTVKNKTIMINDDDDDDDEPKVISSDDVVFVDDDFDDFEQIVENKEEKNGFDDFGDFVDNIKIVNNDSEAFDDFSTNIKEEIKEEIKEDDDFWN